MSASGSVNVEFMKYVLYGGIQNANPRIGIYIRAGATAVYTKLKDLTAVCLPADISNGVRIVCTASDTSQDEYTADAVAIDRSPYVSDGTVMEVAAIHYITVSKSRNQRLDVDFVVEITA